MSGEDPAEGTTRVRKLVQSVHDRVERKRQRPDPRFECAKERVWEELKVSVTGADDGPVRIYWNPGNWLFLYEDEIDAYFLEFVPFQPPTEPPPDHRELTERLWAYFSELQTDNFRCDQVDGGRTPGLLFTIGACLL